MKLKKEKLNVEGWNVTNKKQIEEIHEVQYQKTSTLKDEIENIMLNQSNVEGWSWKNKY